MEYIYAAMAIHKAGKKVDEATLTKVLEAAGAAVDAAKVKVVVASLEGVNIDEAIKNAAVAAPVAAAAPAAEAASGEAKAEKKEEKKEDTAKAEAASAAGLSSLFG